MSARRPEITAALALATKRALGIGELDEAEITFWAGLDCWLTISLDEGDDAPDDGLVVRLKFSPVAGLPSEPGALGEAIADALGGAAARLRGVSR